MTQFDIRRDLDAVADDVHPGPAPSAERIAAEARRLRATDRRRWAVPVVAAAAVVAVAVPLGLAQRGSEQGRPAAGASSTAPEPDPAGPCTPAAATTGRHRVVMVAADCSTSSLQVDVEPAEWVSYASLSPDRSQLAYSVTSDVADARLEVRDLATGETRTIATSSDALGDPVWSPEGTRLAFWHNDTIHPAIRVANLESGTTTDLTGGDEHSEAMPAWSPDGSSLIYAGGGAQLWIIDVTTGASRALDVAPRALKQPFWGAGGQVYALQEAGDDLGIPAHFRVVRLEPDTGRVLARSAEIEGIPIDGVSDPTGLRTASLVQPAMTTIITTLDEDLTVVSEQTVSAEVGNLRAAVTAHPPAGDVDLRGAWDLREATIGGALTAVPRNVNVSLTVHERVSQAQNHCSVLSVTPRVDGDAVQLVADSEAGQMLSCPLFWPESPLPDADYFRAIRAVDHAERAGDTLVLTGPDVRLVFEGGR